MSAADTFTIRCESVAETEAVARRLSLWARPGFVILLAGDLGAGKSTFARAFIRALQTDGADGDIPSPTFSLVQSYADTRVPVFHADLYRLADGGEVDELGLPDLLTTHAGLVEWPERLPRPLGENTLLVRIDGHGDTRTLHGTAQGAWRSALARDAAITQFLSATPWASAERLFLEGDASFRRYETLVPPAGAATLLMDMPQRPDGPAVKDGKPYSAVAHLAESISAVVAVNRHLVALGYSAPVIHAVDLAQGLAVIESLGARVYGRMVLAGTDMREPVFTAAAVLADMAHKPWPAQPDVAPGVKHTVAAYDEDAQLIEVDLLPTWFHPHVRGTPAPADLNASFAAAWHDVLPLAATPAPVWVLRDFHSPNLLWLPEREGLRRVGLIDTQDAVLGHPAYDLVSLTQDARVDMDDALTSAAVDHYCTLRQQAGSFDEAAFRTAYAVLGAQRATKILGIFARLSRRDGKHGYLRHMPRVSRFLARNLSHPALASLRRWHEVHLPEALDVRA